MPPRKMKERRDRRRRRFRAGRVPSDNPYWKRRGMTEWSVVYADSGRRVPKARIYGMGSRAKEMAQQDAQARNAPFAMRNPSSAKSKSGGAQFTPVRAGRVKTREAPGVGEWSVVGVDSGRKVAGAKIYGLGSDAREMAQQDARERNARRKATATKPRRPAGGSVRVNVHRG